MGSFSRQIDTWAFQVDQDQFGEKEQWFAPGFDRSDWMSVKAPGAWDFYHEAFWGYEDVAWYAADIPAEWVEPDNWQRLHFGSVSGHAKVWLNGSLIGEHIGRYLPFAFPISQHLRTNGPNTIVMRVDNISRDTWLPGSGVIEWAQYGGILQPVSLVTSPMCHLSDFAIHAVPVGERAEVTCEVKVENNGLEDVAGTVSFHLDMDGGTYERTASFQCGAGQTVTLADSIPAAAAERWSPDHPRLYEASVRLIQEGRVTDETTDRFGVRTIEVRGSEIMLNGEPIQLRGFNRYDEYGSFGPTVPEDKIREDLLKLKSTGANLVRVHYPQDPVHLRIMDEIGLLLMEEIPLCWWQADDEAKDAVILDAAEEALRQLIARDRNHPCVIIWSMCNESATHTAAGISAMRRLMRTARECDRSRLVTFVATSTPGQLAFEEADLVCINLYEGLFSAEKAYRIAEFDDIARKPTEVILRRLRGEFPGKPILLTEFGTHGIFGLRGDTRFTETHQSAYIEAVWRAAANVEEVRGVVLWAWADYYHRKNFFGGEGPTFWSSAFGPYGVVTVDRQEKEAFRTVSRLLGMADS